jgi:Uma2 family endonuclease
MVAAREQYPQLTPTEYLAWEVREYLDQSNNYACPDVSVIGDDGDRHSTQFISHPYLIVEVLSPSTVRAASAFAEAYDWGKKFKLHRRLPSLREYILVSTIEIAIDVFRQNDRGKWEETNYLAGDQIELESIGLTFRIEEAYLGIVLDNF